MSSTRGFFSPRTCQLLERLVFPPQHASLLLHLALPAPDSEADAAQTPCFAQNLRALEAELWKEGDGTVEPGVRGSLGEGELGLEEGCKDIEDMI